jgi:hypothetical protein
MGVSNVADYEALSPRSFDWLCIGSLGCVMDTLSRPVRSTRYHGFAHGFLVSDWSHATITEFLNSQPRAGGEDASEFKVT